MKLRIALQQINAAVGDIAGNRRRIVDAAARAAERGADLAVFPELALAGYPPEDLLFKPNFVAACAEALRALAGECKGRFGNGCSLLIGAPVMEGGRLRNAAVLIDDGKVAGAYFKRELPNYGVFDEKRYFAPGAKSLMIELRGARIGVTICEDIWVENSDLERDFIAARPSAIVNLSASPFHKGKHARRIEMVRRFARSVKAPLCYVNLVGGQDELVFDGGSLAVDASGETLAAGARFEESLVTVDLDVLPAEAAPGARIECVSVGAAERTTVRILDRDRAAPPALTEAEEIYGALVCGTRDYLHKNGFARALLGLSGGIDSALAACVAAEALGPKNVTGVSMPSRFTSSGTRGDAKILAGNLGINYLEIPIEKVFCESMSELQEAFGPGEPGLAAENLQARIRGLFLMALSNRFGSMVLTTGNKSEIAMGYCTLYGDTAGGFAVLKDLFKETVYELSHFVNRRAGSEVIPSSIITRPPTAELRHGQKDEDSLPPYPVLDPVLKLYIEENRSCAEIAAELGHDEEFVRKIVRTVDRNEYKRRQAPPGVKITPRAFGRDHRMPMTNRFEG